MKDCGTERSAVEYVCFRIKDCYDFIDKRYRFQSTTLIQEVYEQWARDEFAKPGDFEFYKDEQVLERFDTIKEAGIENGDIVYAHVVPTGVRIGGGLV